MDLVETEWEDVGWIELAWDMDEWHLVDTAMNFRVLRKVRNFLTS
jgi:hypothetical protein